MGLNIKKILQTAVGGGRAPKKKNLDPRLLVAIFLSPLKFLYPLKSPHRCIYLVTTHRVVTGWLLRADTERQLKDNFKARSTEDQRTIHVTCVFSLASPHLRKVERVVQDGVIRRALQLDPVPQGVILPSLVFPDGADEDDDDEEVVDLTIGTSFPKLNGELPQSLEQNDQILSK